jgi:hypothetical protein
MTINFRNAMSVSALIAELEGMPEDAIVVFGTDYGDYHHTEQALPVCSVDELPSGSLVESAYSRSQVAIVYDDDVEYFCPKCEEEWSMPECPKCGSRCVTEDGQPAGDRDEKQKYVVLRMSNS